MTTITEYIARTEAAGTSFRTPVGHPSGKLYSGFTLRDGYDVRRPTGGSIDDAMSDEPYRIVALYDEARAIWTYCEGDLNLEVYPTSEAYDAAVESARDFYRQHA